MTTRVFKCSKCAIIEERTALGLQEPGNKCEECGNEMATLPSFPAGVKFKGPGFHCVDYPKSNEQLKRDYGLDKHDSTNPMAEYHEDGYAEEMVSGVHKARPKASKRQKEVEEFAREREKRLPE
jgi:predicted nucleic acid-binding Zn ribbon protein